MNFGEKLKQLRQNKGWSQPELAGAIGIEQSYLSKLENDKSVPSPDMLNRILEAFEIDIDTLLEDVDESEIRNQLKAIPMVSGHLQAQLELAQKKSRRWFIGSAILCVLGLTNFAIGFSSNLSPLIIYDYMSEEIVPIGANGETFEELSSFIQNEYTNTREDLIASGLAGEELESVSSFEYDKLLAQYSSLDSDAFLFSYVYEGQNFVTESTDEQDITNLEAAGLTNGGTRAYELYNTRSDSNSEAMAGASFVTGVFLLALGIFGLFLERRYYRKS